jgi:predicted transcriptional regulator
VTKLLEDAIHRLRQLPETMQDSAARAVIQQLEEEPEPSDLEAIAAGRRDIDRGDFVTLEQWRHDMGLDRC